MAGRRKSLLRSRFSLERPGQVLGNLKTARDFSNLAKRDRETALRLFEYQDFIEAPFMQDLHIRAIYNGLKGHTNRENLLEEFLVALQVKEPVVSEDQSGAGGVPDAGYFCSRYHRNPEKYLGICKRQTGGGKAAF